LESDEYELVIDAGGVGIELEEISRYRNVGSRVQVKRILAGGNAEKAGTVHAGDILVSVNGVPLETSDVKNVYEVIASSPRPLKITLRQPGLFTELLESQRDSPSVSTQVAPAYSGGQGGTDQAQVVTVRREGVPAGCVLGAERGDLLEISYVGRLAADGTVFDGSAVSVNGQGQVGRGGDSSVFFVLGQQPAGQFPPSWDVSLRGMCNSETRFITVPPALGYGSKGLPRRRIPPDAELVYEVKLLSTNGDSQPSRRDNGGWKGVPGEGW